MLTKLKVQTILIRTRLNLQTKANVITSFMPFGQIGDSQMCR